VEEDSVRQNNVAIKLETNLVGHDTLNAVLPHGINTKPDNPGILPLNEDDENRHRCLSAMEGKILFRIVKNIC
jgi:hypothetical protein